ncbi:hypothetical protein BJ508DRAFT_366633 [Ascobolus immersus RN42]|uniref:MHD domain-containing protein n=1 Tax=Ascobolus immersus RN42 TaxID=1160509 RepID=A0A3N4HI96_ASCIM|nr:hypothetical protein BJ508DRAFT_366633 [Ascobolus immersus RN42]
MGTIDALYIYDTLTSTPLLQHHWRRPSTSPSHLLSTYTATPTPRPSVLYLTTLTPPTILFNILHNSLLFLIPSTTEIEPLLVLEFLHRLVDVLEDYFGAPLLPAKLEANYETVILLLTEMCDDGLIFTTESNALRDVVTPPSLMGKLVGAVTGLPSSSLPSLTPTTNSTTLSTIPWRRSHVKHLTPELYVDLIELLTATFAPSGLPLAAHASGTIAFTSKISGVPDLTMTLSSPGSNRSISNAGLTNPCFHPCVRLSRWKSHPGELSFVPPDGKFVLATYEVDLMPQAGAAVHMPVSVEVNTNLGPEGREFEVKAFINSSVFSSSSSSMPGFGSSKHSSSSARFGTSPSFTAQAQGSTSNPSVEDVVITIPLPRTVKALANVRVGKGEYGHEPGGDVVWRIPAGVGSAVFRAEVVLKAWADNSDSDEEGQEGGDLLGSGTGFGEYSSTASGGKAGKEGKEGKGVEGPSAGASSRKGHSAKASVGMPRCALVAFSVKGWVASGVKVESLKVVGGKGVGEGVRPYKGVKYLSRAEGVVVRC